MGRVVEVLVEGVSKRSSAQFVGRTEQYKTAVFGRNGYRIVDFAKIRITAVTSATLMGVPAE